MRATLEKHALIGAWLLAMFAAPICANGQETPAPLNLTTEQKGQLDDLAVRVLRHADAASCRKTCSILVANFTGETGRTSSLGIQLADELSFQLGRVATGIQIVDRSRFLDLLARERIPSESLADHNAARWLAMQMKANVVIVCELREEGAALHLTARLLDAHKMEKQNDDLVKREEQTREEANLSLMDLSGLTPITQIGGPGKYPYGTNISDPEIVYLRAGVNGVGIPRCAVKPDPEYTDEARIARMNGSLVVEVLVTSEGSVIEPRIVQGLPFGLNNSALATLKRWHCEPALKEGIPVTVLVPIEMTFRIF